MQLQESRRWRGSPAYVGGSADIETPHGYAARRGQWIFLYLLRTLQPPKTLYMVRAVELNWTRYGLAGTSELKK